MKKNLFSIILLTITTVGFSTTHTITNSGFTFSPATITINVGDSVMFSIGNNHNVVEVSEATWNANGNTPLPGFSLPFGGGLLPASSLPIGTHYYVCEPHASLGMKGTILVQSATGINENTSSNDFSIYPNPSEGIFQVDIKNTNEQQIFSLNVFDISGANVLKLSFPAIEGNQEIDLSSYPKGIYFLKISDNEKSFYKKIVLK
jgi:plastocyanin